MVINTGASRIFTFEQDSQKKWRGHAPSLKSEATAPARFRCLCPIAIKKTKEKIPQKLSILQKRDLYLNQF